MGYTTDYISLKKAFTSEEKEISIPGSELKMKKHVFESNNSLFLSADQNIPEEDQLSKLADRYIPENRVFEYPLILRKNAGKASGLILMLHGLNEKSWDKYWAWAKYLAENTGRAVLLFPLSFHMDRVPDLWANPRKMTRLVELRKEKYTSNNAMSFINAALSERLSNVPERFLLSGHQSLLDIVELVKDIKAGLHSDFQMESKIDIFGYSIGAFFSQVLLIANPHGLFSDSKFFLFSGGALFNDINGTSRFIMDKHAFRKLHDFYSGEKQWLKNSNDNFREVINTDSFGKPFRAMLSKSSMKKTREDSFNNFKKNIKIISLKKDQVFPFKKIYSAFRKNMKENVEILDSPFFYTHENPFPVSNKPCLIQATDALFEKVFNRAATFLAS